MNMNDILIPNLKEMCDRLEGKDKCLICETIHILENPNNKTDHGSLWMILIFLILFGFDSDFSKIDLGILAKALDGTMNDKREEQEKEETDDISIACCCCGGPVLENYSPTEEETK